jgi:hypothetical protein
VLVVRLCPKSSAVRLDDRPADGQAESEPSFLGREESVEDPCLLRRWQPTPESRTLTTTVLSVPRAVSTCTSRWPPSPGDGFKRIANQGIVPSRLVDGGGFQVG